MDDSPYADLDRPPLHAASLRRALLTGGLWRQLVLHTSTGSTNADAVDAARAGEPEGLVVLAERQTAGRGRLDRQWTSPPRAGIAVSLLLRPGDPSAGPVVPPAAYGWLPLLAGVAVVDAVRRTTPLEPALKWPNDILLPTAAGPAKVAGILAEAVPGPAAPAVVVGIGLNVSVRAAELPPDAVATSLRLAGAPDADRAPVLRALLRSFADWYQRWRSAGGDPETCGLRESYQEDCATLGAAVAATLPTGETLTGTGTGIDADGRLVLTSWEGVRSLSAADITHLRPAPG